ncbi:ATPases of the AAA+ class [Hypoxylon fuscum]|nr:ATPases of the AAA+ class [Hypoxylon fuscum]
MTAPRERAVKQLTLMRRNLNKIDDMVDGLLVVLEDVPDHQILETMPNNFPMDLKEADCLLSAVIAKLDGNANARYMVGVKKWMMVPGFSVRIQEARFERLSPSTISLPSQQPPPNTWEHLKQTFRTKGNVTASYDSQGIIRLDNIMEMTGLEEVKTWLVGIASRFSVTGIGEVLEPKIEELSVVFAGNPGTGKTSVAQGYEAFIRENKKLLNWGQRTILASDLMGNDAHARGVRSTKLMPRTIYTIENIGELDIDARQYLITEMRSLRGMAIFILTGPEKAFHTLSSHGPMLKTIHFPDFSKSELYELFVRDMFDRFGTRMRCKGFRINGTPTKILIERISKGRGTPNFGNIFAVRDAITKILDRQTRRCVEESQSDPTVNRLLITPEDLIGPPPSRALDDYPAWKELQSMVGLKSVKNSLKAMILQTQRNYERELRGLLPIRSTLNRLFLGNSGTGKTTVAKFSEVIVKNAANFIGSYVGESEKTTRSILGATKGKVLVIDEAYMLGRASDSQHPHSYGTAVIDTIVGEIQSSDNEDRCIILLGYRDEMQEMFRNSNPGLARRFPMASAFEFEDYTKEELRKIMDLKLTEQGLQATDDAKNVAMEIIERARNSTTFSNAGEVDNLLGRATERQNMRLASGEYLEPESMQYLEAQDMDEDFDRVDRAGSDIKELFKDMVGRKDLVEKLEGWKKIVQNVKAMNLGDPRKFIPFQFIFRGPPGTGKTTTARKMGKVFYDLGFLATTEVVECSASDLVGRYLGETGPKTRRVFEKALGKVLFIDEAYQLNSKLHGSYTSEAVGEMVNILTQEKFHNKLVVILAGYRAEMDELLATNPGLHTRFPEKIDFQNLSSSQCCDLLFQLVKDISDPGLFTPKYRKSWEDYFDSLTDLPFWGNGRDIQNIARRIISATLSSDMPGYPMEIEDLFADRWALVSADSSADSTPSR